MAAITEPQPPYPTTDHYLVAQLAKDLDGLAFGDQQWYLNFRTSDEYYRPLAQAWLNAQAGWFFDIEKRVWVPRDQLSETQKAMK